MSDRQKELSEICTELEKLLNRVRYLTKADNERNYYANCCYCPVDTITAIPNGDNLEVTIRTASGESSILLDKTGMHNLLRATVPGHENDRLYRIRGANSGILELGDREISNGTVWVSVKFPDSRYIQSVKLNFADESRLANFLRQQVDM